MKNLIGLDIKVKNGYSNYLNKILNGINLFNYVWEIKRQCVCQYKSGSFQC